MDEPRRVERFSPFICPAKTRLETMFSASSFFKNAGSKSVCVAAISAAIVAHWGRGGKERVMPCSDCGYDLRAGQADCPRCLYRSHMRQTPGRARADAPVSAEPRRSAPAPPAPRRPVGAGPSSAACLACAVGALLLARPLLRVNRAARRRTRRRNARGPSSPAPTAHAAGARTLPAGPALRRCWRCVTTPTPRCCSATSAWRATCKPARRQRPGRPMAAGSVQRRGTDGAGRAGPAAASHSVSAASGCTRTSSRTIFPYPH